MRGNYFLGADQEKRFEIRQMELPMPGPGQVLVKNMACGICGTDVHIYEGGKGSAEVTPPVVLGHEYAGIVEALGPGVEGLAVGDHVAIDPNMYCGRCMPCRMGRKQNCEHLFALGVNVDGGMAEYCLCPQTQCFPVDKEIPFDHAAMAEPLACALHGIDRVDIRGGEKVLVVGGGTIGQLMAQLAKLRGASLVVVSEPIAHRRELALRLGADAAIDPTAGDPGAQFKAISGQEGADIVIECVGHPRVIAQAISLAGRGGKVLLFSVPPVDGTAPLPLFDVYQKELTIYGSMINPDTHQRAVNLLNSRRLRLDGIITHAYPLDQVEEAIRMQMGSQSIKVVVHPQE